MVELYIDGYKVELSANTNIAQTYRIADLLNPDKVLGNYTNRFKLPKSDHNRSVLGIIDEVADMGVKPYRKNLCKLVDDGIEVFSNGYAVIESAGDDFEVTVYSGNSNLFADISEKKLSDLDLSDFDHVRDFNTITGALRVSTEGIVYPLIDTGLQPDDVREVDAHKLVPCIFIKDVFERILTEAGYSYLGDFFQTDVWNRLIMPLSALKIDDSILPALGAGAFDADFTTNGDGSTPHRLRFGNASTNQAHTIQQGDVGGTGLALEETSFVEIYNKGQYDYKLTLIIDYNLTSPVNLTQVRIVGTDTDNDLEVIAISQNVVLTGTGTETITVQANNYTSSIGDKIHCLFYISDLAGNGTLTVKAESTFEIIKGKTNAANYNVEVDVALNMPDIKQKDFVKGIMQMFGLLMKSNDYSKELTFYPFKDIYSNLSNSVDWSNKVASKTEGNIEYRLSGLSQQNWFRYKEDEDVEAEIGDNALVVDDLTLKTKGDILTLPFAASEMVKKSLNIDMPQVIMTEEGGQEGDLPIKAEPRILMLNRNGEGSLIGGGSVTWQDYLGSSTTNISNNPFAYFIRPDTQPLTELLATWGVLPTDLSLNWGALLNAYYAEYAYMLTRAKIVSDRFLLDQSDISELNFFKPIYVSKYNAYFYLNEIKNFKANTLTDVTLIRL